MSASRCTEALAQLRQRGLTACVDLVQGAAYVDVRCSGCSERSIACRAGEHLNLPRIFGPRKVAAAERWRDRWIDAGRPPAGVPSGSSTAAPFTPEGEYG